mmetsp:Transcript_16819/g.48895  ORF Transcript_16819/g.48895 Transcript_16819/m.48895 type:complete len:474 (-) Transcript_16819:2420-3841(-)
MLTNPELELLGGARRKKASFGLRPSPELQAGHEGAVNRRPQPDHRVAGHLRCGLLRYAKVVGETLQRIQDVEELGEDGRNALELDHLLEGQSQHGCQCAHRHPRPQAAEGEDGGKRAEGEEHPRLHPSLAHVERQVLASDDGSRLMVVAHHEVVKHVVRADGHGCAQHHGLHVLQLRHGEFRVEHQRHTCATVEENEEKDGAIEGQADQHDLRGHNADDEGLVHAEPEAEHEQHHARDGDIVVDLAHVEGEPVDEPAHGLLVEEPVDGRPQDSLHHRLVHLRGGGNGDPTCREGRNCNGHNRCEDVACDDPHKGVIVASGLCRLDVNPHSQGEGLPEHQHPLRDDHAHEEEEVGVARCLYPPTDRRPRHMLLGFDLPQGGGLRWRRRSLRCLPVQTEGVANGAAPCGLRVLRAVVVVVPRRQQAHVCACLHHFLRRRIRDNTAILHEHHPVELPQSGRWLRDDDTRLAFGQGA